MQVSKESLTTTAELDKRSTISLIQTTGFSMRPFLKGGEKVIVAKTRAEDLKIGDLIVYKPPHFNQTVCHRLVKKVNGKDGWLLYTRGDACPEPDRPIGEDIIIGRVAIVLKGRRVIDFISRWRTFTNLLIVWFYPYIRVTLKAGRRVVSFLFRLVQQAFFYRKIAEFLFYDRVECSELTIQEEKKMTFYFPQASIPFDLREAHTKAGKKMPRLYQFAARYKDKIIGIAALVKAEDKSPYPDWWIHGFYVLLRFGGARIEQKLIQEATDFAFDKGATSINLAVKDRGMFTRRLYEKLGFKVADEKMIQISPKPAFKRYFLMKKELK